MTNVQFFFALLLISVPMIGEDDAPINARTHGGSAADNDGYVQEAHGPPVSAVRKKGNSNSPHII